MTRHTPSPTANAQDVTAIGQLVEVISSGFVFAVAAYDDDCVMRAEGGAWFDIADVVAVSA